MTNIYRATKAVSIVRRTSSLRARSHFATSLLLVILTSFSTHADDVLTWETAGSSANEISKEFGQLYKTLEPFAKDASLATRLVSNPEGESPQSILKKEGLYYGAYFPMELDLLTCRLNKDICSIRWNSKTKTQEANWKNKKGDAISVPDLLFESTVALRPYYKKRGMSIEDIVVRDRGGCESFDEACRKFVSNINASYPDALEESFEGRIVVPTQSYSTEIHVGAQRVSNPEPTESSETVVTEPKPSKAVSAKAQHISKNVSKNILIKPKIRPWSLDLPPDAGVQRDEIFRQIHHPFAFGQPIPDGIVPYVGVFDGKVDANHCDLDTNVCVHNSEPGPCITPQSESCGSFNPTPNTLHDHGTHVVSLIAGRRTAESGAGVNPLAHVDTFEVPFGKLNDDVSAKELAKRITNSMRSNSIRVVNLSFEYFYRPNPDEHGARDSIQSAITALVDNTLFVVAAGNDGLKIGDGGVCSLRPACIDKENVISVVALNRQDDPQLLAESNYGGDFHIGAPGDHVVSAISNGGVGALSGTSQAAPLVTGAASLLYAKSHTIFPGQVKNRLIYTSDFSPSLFGRIIGGRLNVARALDTSAATLKVDRDGAITEWRGTPTGDSQTIFFQELRPNGDELRISSQSIRRLIRHDDGRSYTLFYVKSPNENGAKLEHSEVQLLSKTLETPGINLAAADEPPNIQAAKWSEVVDYVSCFVIDNLKCLTDVGAES